MGENIENYEGYKNSIEVNGIKIEVSFSSLNGSYTVNLSDSERNLAVILNKDQSPEVAFNLASELALNAKDIEDLQLQITLGLSKEE